MLWIMDHHYTQQPGRGAGNCNFVHPFGMAVDEADCGHIYIADSHNKRVQIYTKEWLHVRSIGYQGKITDADDDVGIVGGVAVDTNGSNRDVEGPAIYVTDAGGSDDHGGPRVQVFDECVDQKLSAWYVRTSHVAYTHHAAVAFSLNQFPAGGAAHLGCSQSAVQLVQVCG